MTTAEVQRNMVTMARVMRGEHEHELTLAKAKAQYVRGDIEVDVLERRVEAIMRADQWGWSSRTQATAMRQLCASTAPR